MRIIPDLVSSYDFANSPTAPLPIDEHLRTDQIDHPHEHAEQPTAEEQPPEIDILEELMRNTNLELAGVDSSEALTTLPRVDFSSDTTSIPGMFFHDIPWNPLGSSTYTHPDALSKLQEAIELTAADHDPEISGQRSKRQGIHIRSETESTGSYVTAKTSSTATYFTASSKLGDHNPPALSSIRGFIPRSSWYSHLESRGMIPDAFFEKDWSGRGQHAEFEPDEADLIPLRVEKVIGYSATALVESVMCRRIRLARKTIMCGRRIKREDAVTEVEHLQRLSHFHLIQVIGTCIMGKHLSILLYPVAQYNLETFMDSITERTIVQGRKGKSSDEISAFKTLYLYDFVGCLSNGLHYIHASGTKHMDIKPKNLLVRRGLHGYQIYIADFGIARSYRSIADSETDSPISFTRIYSAPEVVKQERRGLSADIFSLGCVFLEIFATMDWASGRRDRLQKLKDIRTKNVNADTSYQANIPELQAWVHLAERVSLEEPLSSSPLWRPLLQRHQLKPLPLVALMLESEPSLRPSAEQIAEQTVRYRCGQCGEGPERLEAA